MRSASVQRRRDVLVHGRSKCSKSCSRTLVNRKWLDRTKTRMEGSPSLLFFYSCKNLIPSSVKSKVKSQRHLRDTDYTMCAIALVEFSAPLYLFYLLLLSLHVSGPSASTLDALRLCIPSATFLT